MRKFVNRLFSLLLVSLGFAAAACDDEVRGMDMYGTPTVNYSIKGKVSNASSQGVAGMRVIMEDIVHSAPNAQVWVQRDTVFTNTAGGYVYQKNRMEFPEQAVRVIVQDPQGVYQTTERDLEFTSGDIVSTGSWTSKAEKSNINFTLDKK